MKQGIADSDGSISDCFWPRHAITTTKDGVVTDYIICFECYQTKIISNQSTEIKPIARTPQDDFDQLLKDASITLAPRSLDYPEIQIPEASASESATKAAADNGKAQSCDVIESFRKTK